MSDTKIPTFAEWYAQQEPKHPEPTESTVHVSVGMAMERPSAHILIAMQQAQRPTPSEAEQLQQAQAQRGISLAERENLEHRRHAANGWLSWGRP